MGLYCCHLDHATDSLGNNCSWGSFCHSGAASALAIQLRSFLRYPALDDCRHGYAGFSPCVNWPPLARCKEKPLSLMLYDGNTHFIYVLLKQCILSESLLHTYLPPGICRPSHFDQPICRLHRPNELDSESEALFYSASVLCLYRLLNRSLRVLCRKFSFL